MMVRYARLALLLGALAVVTLASRGAVAQDGVALAEALFLQGHELMEAGNYDMACSKFRESDRLDPQVGARLNLARCEERRGKLATSWALYKAVRDALPASDDRVALVEERITALKPRVPTISLKLAAGAPADTVVKLGETEVGQASFGSPLPVDPGRLELIVSAPGYEPRTLAVTALEGAAQQLVVSPGAPQPKPPVDEPPLKPPGGDEGGNTQATIGWVVGALGVASVLVGGGTGVVGLSKKSTGDDNCDDAAQVCTQEGKDANDAARTLLTTTTITWIVGGLAIATGITLILTSEGDDSTTALSASFGPGAAGLTLLHSW